MSIFLLLNTTTTIKLQPYYYQNKLSTKLILHYLKKINHQFYYQNYIKHPTSKSLINNLLQQK